MFSTASFLFARLIFLERCFMASLRKIVLPSGQTVVLVDREQLRFKRHGRCFGIPAFLKALKAIKLPTAPPKFSGSKNRAIKYPILGNDTEGDCYEADALHCVQTWTGNNGPQAQFDQRAVLAEYEDLSGGDNGLSDDDVFPHWKGPGFQGHTILDYMTVDPQDDASIRLGMWLFMGASYTCSLLTGWLNATSPGSVWDAGMGRPDPSAGHAMHLSGYDATPGAGALKAGFYEDETWGIDPAIRLTPAGLKASDPEITLQFSLEMFNASGIAPNGLDYPTLASLWKSLGGITLPPSPFPGPVPIPPTPPTPPTPPIPPTPTPGGDIILARDLPAGSYTVLSSATIMEIEDALAKLAASLPDSRTVLLPVDLRDRLRARRVSFPVLLQILGLILAMPYPPTAESIEALIVQIASLLSN